MFLWRSVFSDSRHVIGTGLLGRLDGECIVLAKASAASARSCCGTISPKYSWHLVLCLRSIHAVRQPSPLGLIPNLATGMFRRCRLSISELGFGLSSLTNPLMTLIHVHFCWETKGNYPSMGVPSLRQADSRTALIQASPVRQP